MRVFLRTVLTWAFIGGLAMGMFGVLTTLDKGGADLLVRLVLAFLVAGAIGATFSAFCIGLPVGLVKAARAKAAAQGQQQTVLAQQGPGPTPEARATLDRLGQQINRQAAQRAAEAPWRGPRPQAVPAAHPVPLAPITPAPARPQPERVDLADPQRLNRVLARLDSLIGLEPVAEQVRQVAHRVAFEIQRSAALGVPRAEIGMHAVFTGPPGVGKTEVARVWGEVLCSLGLLPTDRVVEVSRQDLVAPHVGETAGKTRSRLEEAKGGVFFLDEAYALVPRTGQDFGPEAVAELLAYMENHRSDLCVIVAGYEAEMKEFLGVNPGLASRFSERIDFPAYDAATLVQISANMAEGGQDSFTQEALDALGKAYRRLVAAPPQGWANARSARQILDAVRTARAARVGAGPLDRQAMTTLTEADVLAALARKYPQAL